MIKRCVCFPVLRFMAVAILLLASHSFAFAQEETEGVPVPPQRPKILKVSPAYIEELRRREAGLPPLPERAETEQPQEDMSANDEGKLDMVPVPSPKPPVKGISNNDDLHQKMVDATKAEILEIIGDSNLSDDDTTEQEAEPEGERTLISFSLPPQEIALNDQIRSFLTDHALPLFSSNQNFTMEINAYATPIAGEEYSEIRISLARALEIRKFLMEQNISPTRLKLNQMNNQKATTPDDRIDLILIQ